MKVTLIQHDHDALDVLIFTKSTRLQLRAGLFDEIKAWPVEKKMAELEYMRNTIASSWEFCSYTFLIEGVSRAFTHQLVRHRVGVSFAQQAQRAVDMTGFEYITGPSVDFPDPKADDDDKFFNQSAKAETYVDAMASISASYQELLSLGANKQDARGVLPTNISTNIVMKANLRTLSDMGLKRLCTKAQGEFQDVFRAMRDAVLAVHPWADGFIRVHCAKWGVCMFPTFPVKDCPVKFMVYDPTKGEAYGGGKSALPDQIQEHWEVNRAEAQP